MGAVWQTGLLMAAVQKAGDQATLLAEYYRSSHGATASISVAKWIVLDGEMNPAWMDGVNCLLTEPHTYRAVNSEVTVLHGELRHFRDLSL